MDFIENIYSLQNIVYIFSSILFISGIALVGALVLGSDSQLQQTLAFLAVMFASINVFGGYLVTNRMLKMFKKK